VTTNDNIDATITEKGVAAPKTTDVVRFGDAVGLVHDCSSCQQELEGGGVNIPAPPASTSLWLNAAVSPTPVRKVNLFSARPRFASRKAVCLFRAPIRASGKSERLLRIGVKPVQL
jgi:hypothetical protein